MKTLNLILIGVIVLLIAFGGVRSCQVKNLATQKATLKAEFNQLQKQKEVSEFKLKALNAEFGTLQAQKTTLEQKLTKTLSETSKQIEGFKNDIRALNSLPADTVYQNLFAMYPTYNQVLKFRFAENQIREFNIDILERNQFEWTYHKFDTMLIECGKVNIKNNEIIGNLTGQNDNLQSQVDLSELQTVNVQDELKLSYKTNNKQKRKTFFYQVTTLGGIVGLTYFVIK